MATPPKIEQPSYTTSNYQSALPTKKKPFAIPLIVVGASVVIGLASWFVYKNPQNSDTINSLQDQVSTQEQSIKTQQNTDAEKETERQRVNAATTAKNMNFRNNLQ